MGRRIPADMSVVGYDGLGICTDNAAQPNVCPEAQDAHRTHGCSHDGEKIESCDGEFRSEQVTLPTDLIVRQSSASI